MSFFSRLFESKEKRLERIQNRLSQLLKLKSGGTSINVADSYLTEDDIDKEIVALQAERSKLDCR